MLYRNRRMLGIRDLFSHTLTLPAQSSRQLPAMLSGPYPLKVIQGFKAIDGRQSLSQGRRAIGELGMGHDPDESGCNQLKKPKGPSSSGQRLYYGKSKAMLFLILTMGIDQDINIEELHF